MSRGRSIEPGGGALSKSYREAIPALEIAGDAGSQTRPLSAWEADRPSSPFLQYAIGQSRRPRHRSPYCGHAKTKQCGRTVVRRSDDSTDVREVGDENTARDPLNERIDRLEARLADSSSSGNAHVTALYNGLRALVAELVRRRRQAEETCEILTRVLEATSDAFIALDADWRYTYVNEHAGRMFGREPASLIGKHIWTEFPEGVGQVFHRRVRAGRLRRQATARSRRIIRRTTGGSRTAFSRTPAGSRSSFRTSPSATSRRIACARASSVTARCSTTIRTRSTRSTRTAGSSAQMPRARRSPATDRGGAREAVRADRGARAPCPRRSSTISRQCPGRRAATRNRSSTRAAGAWTSRSRSCRSSSTATPSASTASRKISPPSARSRPGSSRPRRWKRSAGSRAVSRTTSTTCSRSSRAARRLLANEVPPLGNAPSDIAEIQNAARRAAEMTQQLLAFSRKQHLKPRSARLESAR